jgi:hypothetical protein
LDSLCIPPEGGASPRNPLAETQFPTIELHSSAYLVRTNNPSVLKVRWKYAKHSSILPPFSSQMFVFMEKNTAWNVG